MQGIFTSVGKSQVHSGFVGYNHGSLVITKLRGYMVQSIILRSIYVENNFYVVSTSKIIST